MRIAYRSTRMSPLVALRRTAQTLATCEAWIEVEDAYRSCLKEAHSIESLLYVRDLVLETNNSPFGIRLHELILPNPNQLRYVVPMQCRLLTRSFPESSSGLPRLLRVRIHSPQPYQRTAHTVCLWGLSGHLCWRFVGLDPSFTIVVLFGRTLGGEVVVSMD